MKNPKVKINFRKIKDDALNEKTEHIIINMTGNANYPEPSPTLPEVTVAKNEYQTSLEKSKDGTKADTVLKNQKRKILEGLLAQLGDYVNDNSDGDAAKMLSSGFDISKTPTPIGSFPKPEKFTVKNTDNSGEVVIKQTTQNKANGYLILYALDPPPENNSDWKSQYSSKNKMVIKNLVSARKYAFKGAAVGSDPNYNFSDAVVKVVQ